MILLRLNYQGLFDDESVTVHPSMLTKLWLPDLFFANEKKANFHKVTQDNKLVRIYKNGDIYISVRITLTLGYVRTQTTSILDGWKYNIIENAMIDQILIW